MPTGTTNQAITKTRGVAARAQAPAFRGSSTESRVLAPWPCRRKARFTRVSVSARDMQLERQEAKMDVQKECERLRDELTVAVQELPQKMYCRLMLGRTWHRLDIMFETGAGGSGAFMIDAETGAVHGIKGYGRVHPNVYHGPADKLTGAVLLPRRYARAHCLPAAS